MTNKAIRRVEMPGRSGQHQLSRRARDRAVENKGERETRSKYARNVRSTIEM